MRKLLTLIGLLSFSAYAAENLVTVELNPSQGKVGHAFESTSIHTFYLRNNDNVTHIYKWLIKQCPMYGGRPDVCHENDGGKLTLMPGQEFQFNRTLIMHLRCGADKESIPTYALSSLDSDNPHDKFLSKEVISHATCT
jgi:hypothetical protein